MIIANYNNNNSHTRAVRLGLLLHIQAFWILHNIFPSYRMPYIVASYLAQTTHLCSSTRECLLGYITPSRTHSHFDWRYVYIACGGCGYNFATPVMHRNKYDLKIISIMEMSQKMEIRMAPIIIAHGKYNHR